LSAIISSGDGLVNKIEMLKQAKENLILRRETHLYQLMDKFKEKRVQRVIQPMLLGQETPLAADDVEYVVDLGLVHRHQMCVGPRVNGIEWLGWNLRGAF
jgi:hypothetical protein